MDDVRTRTTIGSPVEVTEIVRGKRPSAVSCAASAGPCCGLFVKLDRGCAPGAGPAQQASVRPDFVAQHHRMPSPSCDIAMRRTSHSLKASGRLNYGAKESQNFLNVPNWVAVFVASVMLLT